MRDNDLYGSGLRSVDTKKLKELSINRKASGLGNVKCHVFIFAEAQLHIINQELESVTY